MIPIVVLSGFLGSGKTTLLQHALAYYKGQGLKPAILMNELGDVNLDGSLVNGQAPTKEMLSGCICCTIRGDLGVELMNLAEEYNPDVIIVECTGVANPMEIVDAVTDASIYSSMILQSVITVVDARQFLDFASGHERNKSYRLMQDQLRCASKLIINKTDLLAAGGVAEGTGPRKRIKSVCADGEHATERRGRGYFFLHSGRGSYGRFAAKGVHSR